MVYKNIINILDRSNQTIITIFNSLCTPAKIEYVLGIIGIVSISISCLTQSSDSKLADACNLLIPHIFTVSIATYILNSLCKGGASIVSWIMIILPIITMIISICYKKKPQYLNTVEKFIQTTEHYSNKPALKVFLYPEINMESNQEDDKVEINLPAGKNSKKIHQGDIENAGIDSSKIKSIKKHDDIIMVLFKNPDCTGDKQIFTESLTKLNSRWQGKIGSIYLFRRKYFNKWSKDPVEVYEKPEYEGVGRKLWILPTETVGRYNKSALKFIGIDNNEISSMKIPKEKWIVKLYKADDFVGKYSIFNEDQFKFNKKINNKITSIQVLRKI